MATNRVDLLCPNFPRVLRGYSPKDVDQFLEEIALTLSRQGEEKLVLSNKVARLEETLREYDERLAVFEETVNDYEARIADTREREQVLRQTLLSSERLVDEMKASAEREARLILDSARTRAEQAVSRSAAKVSRNLEDIAELEKLKRQFEMQMRSVLEGHLKLLKSGKDEQDQVLRAVQLAMEKRQRSQEQS